MKSHGFWRERARSWAIRIGLVGLAILWLAVLAVSWANAAEDKDNEFNFSWLDPDKKIYVLQNRKYLKANRPLVSVMGGPAISNAYRTSYDITGSFAFYMSELFGIEAFYSGFINKENNTFDALKFAIGSNALLPVVREIRAQYGLLMHYVPWYSKINVFNQILYFDWYFSGGLGGIHTALDTRTVATSNPAFETQDFFCLFLGTGHEYYLTQNVIVRLDFSGAFYRAQSFGKSGDTTWFSNYSFGLGLGYRL